MPLKSSWREKLRDPKGLPINGDTDVTPYGRTLKTGGEVNPKHPGGVEHSRLRLEAEGHRVEPRDKR